MTNPRSKARIEARVRERVAYCVEFELNDPRSTFITITRVEVSDDLSVAKVFYTVLGGESERSRAAHMLEDASGFVRKQLGRVLETRRIPRLTWIYDVSIEEAERIEHAITEALRHDRAVNPAAHPELEEEEPGARSEDDGDVDREYEDFLEAQDEEGA